MSLTTPGPLPHAHERALDAFHRGEAESAYELLRDALAAHVDLQHLNDLAVIAQLVRGPQEARTLLEAALVLDGTREDVRENLAALDAIALDDEAAWRRSPTIAGEDPRAYERAFPGMPRADTMSEHTSRYAFALGLVGGRDVLDLGCGTGYGSEMLTWTAGSVRGFDIWQPRPHEHPRWPGGPALNYGHDLCRDPLPPADVAVMFEVIEHLPAAARALELAWSAVGTIVASFPNPVHHGSWMNPHHVTDWTLDEFEHHLREAAGGPIDVDHYNQPLGGPLLTPGRDPESSYWVVVARRAEPAGT